MAESPVNFRQTKFNKNRFADEWPSEAIYAEVILSEVQDFIGTFFGSLVQFYEPVVSRDLLDDMEEDFIEIATSMTINERLSPWLLKLCRLCSREDEKLLKDKLTQFKSLAPESVGVGQYFTCNQSSKLFKILSEVSGL